MTLTASKEFLENTRFFGRSKNPRVDWHDNMPHNFIRVHAPDPETVPLKSSHGLNIFDVQWNPHIRDEDGIARRLTPEESKNAYAEHGALVEKHRSIGGVLAVIDPETGHVHHHDGTVTDAKGNVLRGGGEGYKFALSQPHTLVGNSVTMPQLEKHFGVTVHGKTERSGNLGGGVVTGRANYAGSDFKSTPPVGHVSNNPPDLSGDPRRVVDPRI